MTSTARPGATPAGTVQDSRPESLTDLLRRREEVARCSGALAAHLGTTVEHAEALLMGEARRRGVPVHLVARRVVVSPAAAKKWTAEVCSECDEALHVAVLGRYGLRRELVCPMGHPSRGPSATVRS